MYLERGIIRVSSYIRALYDTYNKAEEEGLVGVYDEMGVGIRPIFHTSKRSAKSSKVVNVVLNETGDFVTATELMENEYVTYPVTLQSVGRTRGIAPHGLSDSIQYLTSGYNENKYLKYLGQLYEWEQSEYSTGTVRAVYEYVFRNTLGQDLQGIGVKANKNMFIAFSLMLDGGEIIETNRDESTQEGWIGYMREKVVLDGIAEGISDLTGEHVKIPETYKGTLGSSKIISVANKVESYIGRMPKDKKGLVNPMYKLGLEESLKVFNMIDYLIMNNDTRTYVKMGNPIMMWTGKVGSVEKPDTQIGEEDDILSMFEGIDSLDDISTLDTTSILNEMRRKQMGVNYKNLSDVYLLEIDKVSSGRVSVKNFMTFTEDEYERRLGYWYNTTSWEWGYGRSKDSLAIKDLILRLVGNEEEDRGKYKLSVKMESTESHVNNLVSDVIRSKLYLQRFPIHLYKKAMQNARNRQRYKNTWQRALQAIMSVYKKYNWDYKRQEVSELKDERLEVSDSYKVGQLLAVYERIEEYANYIKGNQRVDTQVSKLWNTATNRPLYALTKIKQQTLPSVKVLKTNNKMYDLEHRITEYMADLANSESFKPNRPLADDFILGYYHEKRELMMKVIGNKQETSKTTEEDK